MPRLSRSAYDEILQQLQATNKELAQKFQSSVQADAWGAFPSWDALVSYAGALTIARECTSEVALFLVKRAKEDETLRDFVLRVVRKKWEGERNNQKRNRK